VKSYNFLFWAYNVVWLGISVYLLWIWLGIRRVDQRLDALERDRD
jgi:CcmD family protein